MTKSKRIAVLSLVLALALATASGTWLVFKFDGQPNNNDFGQEATPESGTTVTDSGTTQHSTRDRTSAAKPVDENSFMTEQMQRVRSGDSARTDTEKALAAMLPDNPTTDDLRKAYLQHLFNVEAAQGRAFVKAHPEYAKDFLPPQDKSARAAFDQAEQIAKRVEEKAGGPFQIETLWRNSDAEIRAAFLVDTAPLLKLLPQALPAPGKVLETYDGIRPGSVEALSSAIVRVAVARASALLAEGQRQQAVQALSEVARFARAAVTVPILMGCLFYTVWNQVVFEGGVLAFAKKGLLSEEELTAMSDLAGFMPFGPQKSADLEFRQSLKFFIEGADTVAGAWQRLPALVRMSTEQDFKAMGATSLDDWVRRKTHADAGGRWNLIFDFQRQIAKLGLDVRNLEDEKADQFLALADTEPRKFLLSAMRSCAASRTELEAYLLAAKLHALRLKNPAGWRAEAQETARAWPLLQVVDTGNGVIIRPNKAQALLQVGISNAALVSVP